jgi:hypothetical protein
MECEIQSLPAQQILLENGDDAVVVARAHQIPQVMQEIGRLREIAFRAVGEGTGKQIDLDAFDSHYDHLFVWRKPDRQILGAYRLGLTDSILKEHGKKGLYTSTLFDFHDGFMPGNHQYPASFVEGNRAVYPSPAAVQNSLWPCQHQQCLPPHFTKHDGDVSSAEPLDEGNFAPPEAPCAVQTVKVSSAKSGAGLF